MVSGNRDNCILELKETPFSNREGRFLMSRRASPCIKETPPLFANNGFHSPLHSERGWGRGCSWVVDEAVGGAWGGFFLNKNNASDLCTHALLSMEMVTN